MALPTVVQPTNVKGNAAAVSIDGQAFLAKDAIKVGYNRESMKIKNDAFGEIDERFLRDSTEISFTPDGRFSTAIAGKLFPLGVTDIGGSCLGKTVIVQYKGGQKVTFANAGITKPPKMHFGIGDTIFGDVGITSIGAVSGTRETANFWGTIAASGVLPSDFDPTLIMTGRYVLSYNSVNYGSISGFDVDVTYGTQIVTSDDEGIQDVILTDITAQVTFAPSSIADLTAMEALMKIQTTPLAPGASFATGSLEICSTVAGGPKVTLLSCGPKQFTSQWGVAKPQFDSITFVSKRTFAVGVPDALITFAVAS